MANEESRNVDGSEGMVKLDLPGSLNFSVLGREALLVR